MNNRDKYNQEKAYYTSCKAIIFLLGLLFFSMAVYQAGVAVSTACRPLFFNLTTNGNATN